jgi:hypothetical protein
MSNRNILPIDSGKDPSELAPPPEWKERLEQLVPPAGRPRSRRPDTAVYPYSAGIDSCTAATFQSRDAPDAAPCFYFNLTLAGWGSFQNADQSARLLWPGQAFSVLSPSSGCVRVPTGSPGWIFVWLRVYAPYLVSRAEKIVEAAGPVVHLTADGEMATALFRLVRGSMFRDFSDVLDAELVLARFVLAFDRYARHQDRDNALPARQV